uniref:Methoprene-tolerant Met n=1 Tax=Hirondellea gigas TaxID=1518452 RepID=A0A6A7FX45_9CRUS
MGLVTEIDTKMTSSARQMRNLAEKLRRDKLNTYMSELASIVPLVADSHRKIDKTSVLRLAANYIRMHTMLGGEAALKSILPADMALEASLELMKRLGNQFLLVATNTGKIVYVSDAVEQTFGHSQVDLLGSSLYNLVHPDDHTFLSVQLKPKETTRRSFFCRFAEKTLSRNESRRYEIIHVQGHLRPIPPPAVAADMPLPARSSQLSGEEYLTSGDGDEAPAGKQRRSTRHYGTLRLSEDDSSGSDDREERHRHHVSDTHILVALVQQIQERPITELSRVESMRDEYITRHDICGNILYSDHRIAYVTGHMPEAVIGDSAFMYMHQNDMLWSLVAQKQMFGTAHGQGVVSYRLRCRDNSYVTLRSRGYIEFNRKTGELESFVCINSVVEPRLAQEEIKQQRRKLLPVCSGGDTDQFMANINSDFPVEILEMIKRTLGLEKIQQLMAAMAKFSMDKPFDETEDLLLSSPQPSKTGKTKHLETQNPSTSLKEQNLSDVCKGVTEKKLITLNTPTDNHMVSTKVVTETSHTGGQKRKLVECLTQPKVLHVTNCTNGEDLSDITGFISSNTDSSQNSKKVCYSSPCTAIVILDRRETLTSDVGFPLFESINNTHQPYEQACKKVSLPQICAQVANTSRIPDANLILLHESQTTKHRGLPDDKLSQKITLLECDARKQKQQIQMEQMTFNMRRTTPLGLQHNLSPSTSYNNSHIPLPLTSIPLFENNEQNQQHNSFQNCVGGRKNARQLPASYETV